VFFLFCPFSGARLERLLDDLEPLARQKSIRLCCVDMPELSRSWLEPVGAPAHELAVYRSVLPSTVRSVSE
jgi:hypothetical protein